jgi:hypothetical protein
MVLIPKIRDIVIPVLPITLSADKAKLMQVAADPRTGCRTVSHIVGIAVDQRNGKAGIPAITLLADFMEKINVCLLCSSWIERAD